MSIRLEQYVFNDLAKIYEIELGPLLNEILANSKQPAGCGYGEITYSSYSVHFTNNAYFDDDNITTVLNGVLSLPIAAANSTKGEIGTVTIEVTSTNYQTFEMKLYIIAQDRIPPDPAGVAVRASEITYGQTLADSRLTATGSMKDPRTGAEINGTYTWKDSTIKPGAGSYEAEWVFTPDASYGGIYAAATGKVTVTVNRAALTDVSVKQKDTLFYSGEPQRADVAFTGIDGLEGITFVYAVSPTADYDTRVPAFTDAGTYTVSYHAYSDNYFIPDGSFTVTISPLPLSLLSVNRLSKTYDGSASVTLLPSMMTFFSKTAKRSDIKVSDTALTISDARFTKQQGDKGYLPSPEVGGGKTLSFTMTLASGNYVFEKEPDGTKTVSSDISTDDADKFTITKADAPANIEPGTMNVVNGTTQNYTFDFKTLLPAAPKGEYGAVRYSLADPKISLGEGYYLDLTTVEFKDGVLTLVSLYAQEATHIGTIGTITVKVSTDNYADFDLTLELSAVNKTRLTPGDISCAPITYGDALSKSAITGTMYAVDDTEKTTPVSGAFEWEQPDALPTDGAEVYFIFTPDDTDRYEAYTGKLTIKVNPKSIENAAVTIKNPTYDGKEWPYPAKVTVVLDGKPLRYNMDYTYSALNPPGDECRRYLHHNH